MVEAMQALRTVDWFGPSRASEDWNKWCEVAQKHGLRAEIVEASSLDHYARRPSIAAQVVRLVQEGRIEAMLLVEWDQLFVTLLDEDQRKILYRRRYFDEAWSGRIIELAAGSEPDRCRD